MDSGVAPAPRAISTLDGAGFGDIVEESGTISKESLLAISRGDLKHFLTNGSDDNHLYIQRVHRIWLALLATMHDSSKTSQHTTAVCNAVCVFLESARSSPTTAIRSFAMSAETWVSMFDALLAAFHSGKLKPLRQVLKTLIKILAQQKDRRRARSIEDGVLSRMGSIILLGKPASYFKASIVIFEAFSRSNVPTSRVLAAIGRCHGSNLDKWTYRLRRLGFDPMQLNDATQDHPVDNSICHFTFALALAVADSDSQATAGTFSTSFMSTLDDCHLPLGSLWSLHVAYILRRIPMAIEPFKHYLLVPIFRLHADQFYDLLHIITSTGENTLMLQHSLAVVAMGHHAGLASEPDVLRALRHISGVLRPPSPRRSTGNLDTSPAGFFGELLAHSSIIIRIQTYDLLANSTGTRGPIGSSNLLLLSKNLAYLQGDPDPNYRGQIDRITKTLVRHLIQASKIHANAPPQLDTSSKQHQKHKDQFVQAEHCLRWFVNFQEDELGPNCSFPRHISALRALKTLVDSEPEMLGSGATPSTSGQASVSEPWSAILDDLFKSSVLWRLLLDPFEEARVITASIIKSLLLRQRDTNSQGVVGGDQNERHTANLQCQAMSEACPSNHMQFIPDTSSLLEDGNRLATLTNRADHADGVGHLLALQSVFGRRGVSIVGDIVAQLQGALEHLGHIVSFPITAFSLHGYLIGLRYIIENSGFYESVELGLVLKGTDTSLERLLKLCKDIWVAVRNELCIDSPEVSRDPDATGPLEGPRDVLAYSWRALRDSSLLTQSIIWRLGSGMDTCAAENCRLRHLRTIYALCFEQLTALRHRGAFSAVAQTFALCCERLAAYSALRNEVKGWYEEALQILEDQSSTLTRRSAGIPAILTGILMASTLEDFNHTITALTRVAEPPEVLASSGPNHEDIRLPEVHALNCLREIFTDYRFRDRTVPWLITVLDLAAASLNSKLWAIRNCGLMLFRACATRIGTSCNANDLETGELPSQRQAKAVLSIATKLLKSDELAGLGPSELVFAGLDLVSRIRIPKNDQSRTRQAILLHIGSRIWMIRGHAARVYAFQLPDTEALEAATDLISAIAVEDQNRCHGILLCARELLERHEEALVESVPAMVLAFEQALKDKANGIEEHGAPLVRSAFAQITTRLTHFWNRQPSEAFSVFNQQSRSRNTPLDTDKPSTARAKLARPGDSYLQTTLTLYACTSVLNGDSTGLSSLLQIFQSVAAYDLDSATAVLQKLGEQRRNGHYPRLLLIELYADVIRRNMPEDIATTALLGLSACVGDTLEEGDSLAGLQGIEVLVDIIANLSRHGSRDLFNARVRALGSLLSYVLSRGGTDSIGVSETALALWIRMLKTAATDATEAWTRLNAAKSLHGFRHSLSERLSTPEKIALFSILYDFLNDDDEEIRDLAASTTSFLLLQTSAVYRLPLSALAACHRFSSYMAEMFPREHLFHSMVFSRIILPEGIEVDDLGHFTALTSLYSVKKQLRLARHVSHDLFEEERQNLYVDDFREIEIWCSTLRSLDAEWIDESLRISARGWALDGLQEVCAALPDLIDGPFGASSKLEVVALFLRVIKVACLSLQWGAGSDRNGLLSPESRILAETKRLLRVTREFPIHNQAKKVLEESFKSLLEADEKVLLESSNIRQSD